MSTFDSFEVEVDDEEKGMYKLSIDPKKKPRKRKIRDFWLKYGEKIILAIGIVLIAVVSFEAGFLKGQKNRKEPVEVNQPACAPCQKVEESSNNSASTSSPTQSSQSKIETQLNTDNQKCAFIASKNSNKYHLLTCQWAAKIKPENKICFSSAEEAQKRGYQGAKCCIK